MKKAVFLMVLLLLLVGMPFMGAAGDVNINIGITPPPPPPPVGEPLAEALPPGPFDGPPDVVVVPSGATYVYMVPNTVGFYFFDNYWYRFYRGYWYRSVVYSGPWSYIEIVAVPRFIVDVPPEYVYYLPPGYHRIHYYDLHRHWRAWDRSRHWHRYDWYKHELRHDVRRDRYRRIEMQRKQHPRGDAHRPPAGIQKKQSDAHRPPAGIQKKQSDGKKSSHQQKGQDDQQHGQRMR